MAGIGSTDFAKKLQTAGATIWHQESNYVYVSKGDRHVRVFFNADDRFCDATKTGGDGKPLDGPDRTLRSMAAVERHLGI